MTVSLLCLGGDPSSGDGLLEGAAANAAALLGWNSVGAVQPSGLHLRVSFGQVSLLVPGSLRGIRAVLKLGAEQEVSAQVRDKAGGVLAEDAEEGSFCTAVVSSEAVWKVHPRTGETLQGPTPPRIFLQLWRGSKLLGLSRSRSHGTSTFQCHTASQITIRRILNDLPCIDRHAATLAGKARSLLQNISGEFSRLPLDRILCHGAHDKV